MSNADSLVLACWSKTSWYFSNLGASHEPSNPRRRGAASGGERIGRSARAHRRSRRNSSPGAGTGALRDLGCRYFDARHVGKARRDDFQRYASGKWLDTNEIPADKSSNGIGSELNDRNQDQLRTIVMGAPKDGQLGAFYASYMDEARLEQLDAAPLKADLRRVDAINSKAEFTSFMARVERRSADPVRGRRAA